MYRILGKEMVVTHRFILLRHQPPTVGHWRFSYASSRNRAHQSGCLPLYMSTNRHPPALPPKLQTLHTKPSWHNRAGRVDRSACFVLTASQLWRRVPDDQWTYRLGKPLRNASADHSQPPVHNRAGKPQRCVRPGVARRLPKSLCDRYADHPLYARDRWLLHKWQQPDPLQGDFRTTKTNALKSRQRAQPMRQDAVLGTGPINPNRGVGFAMGLKRLGPDCLWNTTLRIERIVQHANLKQHFLICPVCRSVAAGSQPGGQTTPIHPSGHGPTATKSSLPKLPGGRVTKLYLPLCTEQEYDDAQLAHLWLQTHTHPNRPLSPTALQLINRYSEFFDPPDAPGRQLRCRHCLGLRYGEVKPTKAANAIGGLAQQRTKINKTADPIGGFAAPRHSTEQTLLLQNLPKLLKKPTQATASALLSGQDSRTQARQVESILTQALLTKQPNDTCDQCLESGKQAGQVNTARLKTKDLRKLSGIGR